MKPRFVKVALLIIGLFFVWSLAGNSLLRSRLPATANQAEPVEIAWQSKAPGFDLQHIPLGDGRISTQPENGSVWACATNRRPGRAAHASGDWIHSDGTYDLTAKPTVPGSVRWQSQFRVQRQGTARSLSGNRLPQDPTGRFPISPSDYAYNYDRNPNTIQSANYRINVAANPQLTEASCLRMGTIGVLLNGAHLFNALDVARKDAVAYEIQDRCQGHPERSGIYHYHSVPTCLDDRDSGQGHSALVGYALDGFGIYGHRGENGKTMTNADLDACHGHTHPINWDGKSVKMYHYHATWEYPYTLGCYRGTPVQVARSSPRRL